MSRLAHRNFCTGRQQHRNQSSSRFQYLECVVGTVAWEVQMVAVAVADLGRFEKARNNARIRSPTHRFHTQKWSFRSPAGSMTHMVHKTLGMPLPCCCSLSNSHCLHLG